MWSSLTDEDKLPYKLRAAEERDRVSKEIARYDLDALPQLEAGAAAPTDPTALTLPIGRMRKICKLDPEVKGLTKEAVPLITKCAELFLSKLGQETVKVARLQNRRTLLPADVAQICTTREKFLFLREDVKDLMQAQLNEKKQQGGGSSNGGGGGMDQAKPPNTKPLTAYFQQKPPAAVAVATTGTVGAGSAAASSSGSS